MRHWYQSVYVHVNTLPNSVLLQDNIMMSNRGNLAVNDVCVDT